MLCQPDLEAEGPAGDRLLRRYFGMHRFDWEDGDEVEWARRWPCEEVWKARKRG